MVDQIANKTATQVAGWLPSQSPVGAPASAPRSQRSGCVRRSCRCGPRCGDRRNAPPAPAATATGSIGRGGPVLTSVPNVTGAPGDGSIALTGAIQRELSRNGVSLTSAAGDAYKVEGKVTVGAVRDGKQPITIDWHVKDPKGKQLGTVSQKKRSASGLP